MQRDWKEKMLCFVCDFWWAILIFIVLLVALLSTRCLWFQSSCQASIQVRNGTPYALKIELKGDETKTLFVNACKNCQIYQATVPSSCPASATKNKQSLSPSTYSILAEVPDHPTTPIAYQDEITIEQHKSEDVCLIVLDGKIVRLGTTGVTDATPTTETETTTPLPGEETPTVVPITPSSTVWQEYTNDKWGFSIKYPNNIGDKAISLNEEEDKVLEGPDELLLLSNLQENYLQDIPNEEELRVLIYRQAIGDETFDQWSIQMSGYAGAGQLEPIKKGNCKGYSITPTSPVSPYKWSSAQWIETDKSYYGIVILSLSTHDEFPTIIDSFLPEECK
jgi:hypothetical protein